MCAFPINANESWHAADLKKMYFRFWSLKT